MDELKTLAQEQPEKGEEKNEKIDSLELKDLVVEEGQELDVVISDLITEESAESTDRKLYKKDDQLFLITCKRRDWLKAHGELMSKRHDEKQLKLAEEEAKEGLERYKKDNPSLDNPRIYLQDTVDELRKKIDSYETRDFEFWPESEVAKIKSSYKLNPDSKWEKEWDGIFNWAKKNELDPGYIATITARELFGLEAIWDETEIKAYFFERDGKNFLVKINTKTGEIDGDYYEFNFNDSEETRDDDIYKWAEEKGFKYGHRVTEYGTKEYHGN